MDERKRELRDAYKAQQRAKIRESMPITDDQAAALFAYLAEALDAEDCDDTPRFTRVWASQNNVNAAALGEWLEELGGFCDCEVLDNAEEAWKDSLRGTDRERK
ncbi:MAG: DUF2695 domain-containing protein [Phycisphaerales bacterium]